MPNTLFPIRVIKRSTLSGKIRTRMYKMTKDEIRRYEEGEENIQTIFPNMPVNEREFLITGITPEEWQEAFPPYCDVCNAQDEEECKCVVTI